MEQPPNGRTDHSGLDGQASSSDHAAKVPTDADGKTPTPWTVARRVLAATVLVGGAIAAVASYWWPPLEVCRVVTGGQPLVAIEICNPWGAVELMPFGLVGLLLLLPDLSELSVANVFTLKREVKSQKRELEATVSRQDSLERQLTAQVASLQATQTSSNYIFVGSAAHLDDEIREKARRFVPGGDYELARDENESARTQPIDRAESRQAQLAMDLISAWEELQPFVNHATGRSREMLEIGPKDEASVRRWYKTFRDEIEIVRAARNNVAHAKPIGDADLRGAVSAAHQLEQILRAKGLTASREPTE